MNERIICAAIRLPNGKLFYGHRHNHCKEAARGELSWTLNRKQMITVRMEEGFITSYGRFLDRQAAWKIAKKEKQIIKQTGAQGVLYSEDLY